MKAFAPLMFGGAVLAAAVYSGFANLAGCIFICLLALSVGFMPGKAIGRTVGTLFVAALLAALLNPQINPEVVTDQAGSLALPDLDLPAVTPPSIDLRGAEADS